MRRGGGAAWEGAQGKVMRDPTTLRDFDSHLWAMLQKGIKQRVTWPFHLSGSVWEIDGETGTNKDIGLVAVAIFQKERWNFSRESGYKHREDETHTRDIKEVVIGLGDQADMENEIMEGVYNEF